MAAKPFQVAEAEVGDARAEGIGEAERRQRREATGAPAADGYPRRVGEALLGQPEGRVRAVVDVDDAPALMELVAEGAAVTGRAAVVDIHDRECRGS